MPPSPSGRISQYGPNSSGGAAPALEYLPRRFGHVAVEQRSVAGVLAQHVPHDRRDRVVTAGLRVDERIAFLRPALSASWKSSCARRHRAGSGPGTSLVRGSPVAPHFGGERARAAPVAQRGRFRYAQ